jgi:Leucine-rich repeat (LRR) protein
LPSLEDVDLKDNSIEVLELDAFSNLTKVQRLALDNNKLTELSGFESMTNLVYLTLANNLLDENIYISSQVDLRYLKVLDLKANKIKSLPSDLFLNLPSLVNLDLSENMIGTIEKGAFNGLINIRCLNLAKNSLTILDLDVFDWNGMENLMILQFNGNNLLEKVVKGSGSSYFGKCQNRVIVKVNYKLVYDCQLKSLATEKLIKLVQY